MASAATAIFTPYTRKIGTFTGCVKNRLKKCDFIVKGGRFGVLTLLQSLLRKQPESLNETYFRFLNIFMEIILWKLMAVRIHDKFVFFFWPRYIDVAYSFSQLQPYLVENEDKHK